MMRAAPLLAAVAALLWPLDGAAQPGVAADAVPAAAFARGPALRPAITLAALGHGALTLTGGHAVSTVAFPLPDTGMASGELTLAVQVSPALAGRSQVRVFVEDALAGVTSVSALRAGPSWTLRLGHARGPWLHVRLEAALSVEHPGPCDSQAGAMWVRVDAASALRYAPAAGVESIDAFLRFPGGRLVVDADWSTAAGQAGGIAVYAALRRATRDAPVDVILAGATPAEHAIALPSRHVKVAAPGTPVRREGDTLSLPPDESAIRLIDATRGRGALLAGGVARPSVTDEPAARCGPQRLCLSDLGLREQAVSGTGALATSFGFTLADIGGWPDEIAFDLDAAFDTVPADTLERAVARVRLNGALLETADIRGRSALQRSIPLPAALIGVANRVEVEFFYAPVSGNCQGSSYAFSAELRRTSAIRWSGSGASRGLLGEIIARPGTRVSLDLVGATPALARTAARVLGAVNVYRAQPIVAQIGPADDPAFRFVVGRSLPASVPVRFLLDRGLEVRSAATGRTLISAAPDRPLVSLEYQPDRALLVLQSSAGAGEALEGDAFGVTLAAGRWVGAAGNALVSNGDQTVTLDLGSPAFVIAQATAGAPWWIAWRAWIFAAAAAGVVVLLFRLQRRLGRRPAVPARPAH